MDEGLLAGILCELKLVDFEKYNEWDYKNSLEKSYSVQQRESCSQKEDEYYKYKRKFSFDSIPMPQNESTVSRLIHVKHITNFVNKMLNEYGLRKRHEQFYSTRRLQFSIDRSCRNWPIEKCTVVSAIWEAEWIYERNVIQV